MATSWLCFGLLWSSLLGAKADRISGIVMAVNGNQWEMSIVQLTLEELKVFVSFSVFQIVFQPDSSNSGTGKAEN